MISVFFVRFGYIPEGFLYKNLFYVYVSVTREALRGETRTLVRGVNEFVTFSTRCKERERER